VASADGTGYSVAFLLDLFIDDGGWNSTFGRAIEKVKEAFPGLEVQTLEEISPGSMTTDIAEDLAMDGVDMVIATTYVQDDILAIADMYPDTKFLTWAGWQTADNVGHYDAATEDGRYLDGLIAGSITKTGKIGYVGGYSFEEPNRALNAFTIGLKEINPEATVDVVFINSWWDPPVEAQAAEALANAGADILAHELNSPALASVAEERGLHVIGYTSDRSAEAPNAWLSSFTIEWGPYFIDQISSMIDGVWEAELTFGGLADDMIGQSPYGPDVTDEIIALVDEARAGIIDGSLDFFAGPLVDNEGNVVVAEGDTIPFDERTTCCLWLLEGISGGSSGSTDSDSGDAAAPAEDSTDSIKVALLLPGVRNDNSFSQAGYEGLLAAAAADGSVEYQVIEEIVDPTDSLPAIRDFASQGYDLIIGHGIEYVDPIQQLWAEFPEVDFAMAGGILIPGSVTTPNVADWLYNTQDMAWPNGVLTANALVGDTIGIVGGPEFDFVKGMHQSYRDAVMSVNPNIDFLEGFAGSFVDVQRAAEVAQQHIDQGADLIYCSGDGICIGAAQAASAAGIPIAVGFGSQEQAAPDVYLSATVIRLDGLYGVWFDQVRDGSFGTSEGELTFGQEGYAFFPSGIFNGQVEVMPVNMNATVETALPLAELQAIMDDFVSSVENGEFMIPFPG